MTAVLREILGGGGKRFDIVGNLSGFPNTDT